MKVKDIMNASPRSCRPQTNLAEVATLMWDGDCGVIPVVEDGNRAIGMVTDRDICIAVATRRRRADEIQVRELCGGELFSCRPEDEVLSALHSMGEHKVRRLPVLNQSGELVGVLSLNDIILEAKEKRDRRTGAPTYEEVLNALKSICGHRLVAVAA
ncbi:MAG: CBS domain-containing protein [bacterium]